MRISRHRPGAALAAAAIVVVVGCGTASPSPSSAPAATPGSAAASTLGPAAAALEYAIRQRETFGLRSDRAWVEAVAADPRATVNILDIPMLPEEEAEFTARQADFEAVTDAARAYAATVPDEFGGQYIDQARHVVVAMWTARPEEHRLRVLERLQALGPLEVRLVAHSKRELEALQERITADLDWIRGAGAQPLGVGVELMDNLVSIQVSSANPAMGAQILLHYGVGPDMLRVDSDGSGVALLPRGTIRGIVVTADGGAPGPASELMVSWESAGPGECGIGDMGYGVGVNGRFELPCAPGDWTIQIMAPRVPEGWEEVGRGRVEVPAGGTVELRIVLVEGARISR